MITGIEVAAAVSAKRLTARPAALVLGAAAPNAVALWVLGSELPALPGDRALGTDLFGDLLTYPQRASTTFGIEQIGVHAPAGRERPPTINRTQGVVGQQMGQHGHYSNSLCTETSNGNVVDDLRYPPEMVRTSLRHASGLAPNSGRMDDAMSPAWRR